MAQKTRADLVTQSNNTFQDAPPANITPPNHRQFNEDSIDSAAMVADDNTFEEFNSFNKVITSTVVDASAFDALSGFINAQGFNGTGESVINYLRAGLFQNSYNASVFNAAPTINMSGLDGNICFIENPVGDVITEFTNGKIGIIVYATFTDDTLVIPTGLSVVPTTPIKMFANDTLIFVFQQTNQIRILGLKRASGDYFNLPDIAAYNTLRLNGAFQVGAYYNITAGYINPPSIEWDIRVLAITPSYIDRTAFLSYGGNWYPAVVQNQDLSAGTITFNGATDLSDVRQWNDIISENPNFTQWGIGSKVYISDNSAGQFQGQTTIEGSNYEPINRNILNTASQDLAAFGRIKASPNLSDNLFFRHHGTKSSGWGNNSFFETTPITGLGIIDFNDTQYGNTSIGNLNILSCYYKVTNDCVTIYVYGKGEFSFNQTVQNQNMLLFFPLPFISEDSGGGFGAVNFDDAANHEDIGGIVNPHDSWACKFTPKWRSTLNTLQAVTFSFQYTYLTKYTVED